MQALCTDRRKCAGSYILAYFGQAALFSLCMCVGNVWKNVRPLIRAIGRNVESAAPNSCSTDSAKFNAELFLFSKQIEIQPMFTKQMYQ
jgi:hypothetical protein